MKWKFSEEFDFRTMSALMYLLTSSHTRNTRVAWNVNDVYWFVHWIRNIDNVCFENIYWKMKRQNVGFIVLNFSRGQQSSLRRIFQSGNTGKSGPNSFKYESKLRIASFAIRFWPSNIVLRLNYQTAIFILVFNQFFSTKWQHFSWLGVNFNRHFVSILVNRWLFSKLCNWILIFWTV